MGGAWLCHHLWEHYLFTPGREFLERIYPTMKGAVQFFMDHLVPESHGWYVTSPSSSFESSFRSRFGRNAAVCMGPTMERRNTHRFIYQLSPSEQIVRD